MGFYTQNKLQRPVRLCESTRQFAFDSLNQVYGNDTLKAMDIPLDDIENLGSLSPLEKYDTAISEIAQKAPIRICKGEKISGSASLGSAIRGFFRFFQNITVISPPSFSEYTRRSSLITVTHSTEVAF